MRLLKFYSIGVLSGCLLNVCAANQQNAAQTISSKLANLSEDMYMLAQEIKRVSADNSKITEQLSTIRTRIKAAEDFRAVYEKDRTDLADKINKAIDTLSSKISEINTAVSSNKDTLLALADDKVSKLKTEVNDSLIALKAELSTSIGASIEQKSLATVEFHKDEMTKALNSSLSRVDDEMKIISDAKKDIEVLSQKYNTDLENVKTSIMTDLKFELEVSFEDSIQKATATINSDLENLNNAVKSLNIANEANQAAMEEHKRAIMATVEERMKTLTKQLKDGIEGFTSAFKHLDKIQE